MLKKKELSKKKNLLMVLWDDSIAFRVLFFILAYLVLGFINMPFEKWLEPHSTEWRSTETPHYFFLQGLTHEKANFIENSFFVLPIFEALAVALICFIIYGLFYSVSKMIAFRNYCYIPLTEDEVKEMEFKNADEYFAYVLNKLTYGFKNGKENLQVSDDDLRKILITCLNVFPDNGTIFQINQETAYEVSDNILFSDAVILNCGKAEIINKHVVLSGVNRNGKREEYTV